MSVRDTLNKNQKVVGTGAVVLTLACMAIGWTVYHPRHVAGGPGKLFYTTDDSSQAGALAALFVDEGTRVAPFEHEGKPAYLAYVLTADGGKTKYVAYLERLSGKGKQMMEDFNAGKIQDDPVNPGSVMEKVAEKYTEVKKPGVGEWVRVGDVRSQAVMSVVPPDGGDVGKVKSVLP